MAKLKKEDESPTRKHLGEESEAETVIKKEVEDSKHEGERTAGQGTEKLRKVEKTYTGNLSNLQVKTDADGIKNLGEEKKIKKLLILAEVKGLDYAVQVARKTGDPYLLDKLHDLLAQEERYKKFIK